jgi:hypothetical protein
MPGLIALLQCRGQHDGPWMRPNGGKVAAKMYPKLVQGERIVVEIEADDSHRLIELNNPVTPLDLHGAIRYRVRKFGEGSPTTVEVVSDA